MDHPSTIARKPAFPEEQAAVELAIVRSAWRILLRILFVIFAAGAAVQVFFYSVRIRQELTLELVELLLIAIVALPALYQVILKPLARFAAPETR